MVEFYVAVNPGTSLPVISAQGKTVTSQINFPLLFFGYHLKCLIGLVSGSKKIRVAYAIREMMSPPWTWPTRPYHSFDIHCVVKVFFTDKNKIIDFFYELSSDRWL